MIYTSPSQDEANGVQVNLTHGLDICAKAYRGVSFGWQRQILRTRSCVVWSRIGTPFRSLRRRLLLRSSSHRICTRCSAIMFTRGLQQRSCPAPSRASFMSPGVHNGRQAACLEPALCHIGDVGLTADGPIPLQQWTPLPSEIHTTFQNQN